MYLVRSKCSMRNANQTFMCLDPHLNWGWGWRRETGLSPPVKYFTDRSNAVLLCGSFVFCCFLCFSCFRVCSLLPCGHLLGKGWHFGSCSWCLLYLCYFPMLYPGSGVVLDCIVSWSLPSFWHGTIPQINKVYLLRGYLNYIHWTEVISDHFSISFFWLSANNIEVSFLSLNNFCVQKNKNQRFDLNKCFDCSFYWIEVHMITNPSSRHENIHQNTWIFAYDNFFMI